MSLKQCSVCGNEYDKLIEITIGGKTNLFDCFECAIHALAPKCTCCGIKVIGHGSEVDNSVYCSAHCARKQGQYGITDRATSHVAYTPPGH